MTRGRGPDGERVLKPQAQRKPTGKKAVFIVGPKRVRLRLKRLPRRADKAAAPGTRVKEQRPGRKRARRVFEKQRCAARKLKVGRHFSLPARARGLIQHTRRRVARRIAPAERKHTREDRARRGKPRFKARRVVCIKSAEARARPLSAEQTRIGSAVERAAHRAAAPRRCERAANVLIRRRGQARIPRTQVAPPGQHPIVKLAQRSHIGVTIAQKVIQQPGESSGKLVRDGICVVARKIRNGLKARLEHLPVHLRARGIVAQRVKSLEVRKDIKGLLQLYAEHLHIAHRLILVAQALHVPTRALDLHHTQAAPGGAAAHGKVHFKRFDVHMVRHLIIRIPAEGGKRAAKRRLADRMEHADLRVGIPDEHGTPPFQRPTEHNKGANTSKINRYPRVSTYGTSARASCCARSGGTALPTTRRLPWALVETIS